jgi:hypothetical protein
MTERLDIRQTVNERVTRVKADYFTELLMTRGEIVRSCLVLIVALVDLVAIGAIVTRRRPPRPS